MKRYKMLLILAALMMGLELFGSKGYEKLKTGSGIYNTGIAGSNNSVFSSNFVSKANYPVKYKPFHPPWSLRRSPVITRSSTLLDAKNVLIFPISEDPALPKTFGIKCKVTINHKMYETGIEKWPVKVTAEEIQMARKGFIDRSEKKVQQLQKKIDSLTEHLLKEKQAGNEFEWNIDLYGHLVEPLKPPDVVSADYKRMYDSLHEHNVYLRMLELEKKKLMYRKNELIKDSEYVNIKVDLSVALKKGPIDYSEYKKVLSLHGFTR